MAGLADIDFYGNYIKDSKEKQLEIEQAKQALSDFFADRYGFTSEKPVSWQNAIALGSLGLDAASLMSGYGLAGRIGAYGIGRTLPYIGSWLRRQGAEELIQNAAQDAVRGY